MDRTAKVCGNCHRTQVECDAPGGNCGFFLATVPTPAEVPAPVASMPSYEGTAYAAFVAAIEAA